MLRRIVNGILSEDEKKELHAAKTETRFRSSLNVFKATNGIRPAEFSVIVGKQGNGKSALCKTISMECAINGHRCYHLLSEEKASVYKSTIANTFNEMTNGKADKFLERLYFDSMLDWEEKHKNLNSLFSHLEDVINEILPEMIIFDNFTTSFLGSLPIAQQGVAVDRFRKMAAVYDVAIIGVFHTAKGTDIYARVIDGEDVRGNASATNAGSYNYILSTYFRADPPRAILTIDKARYHTEANKTYWELNFDKTTGTYTADKKITFDEVQGILNAVSAKSKENLKKIQGGKSW